MIKDTYKLQEETEGEFNFDFTPLQKNVRDRQEKALYVHTVILTPQPDIYAYHREEVRKWLLTWGYHKLITLDIEKTEDQHQIIESLTLHHCLDLTKAGNPDYLPTDIDIDPLPTVDNTLFIAVPTHSTAIPEDRRVMMLKSAKEVSQALMDTLSLKLI